MTPAPSGIIETNDGVTAPYYVSILGERLFSVHAELPASESIEYLDIYDFEGEILEKDWPPTSNIDDVEIDNGIIHVLCSNPWIPAPFNLNFELQMDNGIYEFYITLV